MLKEGGGLAFDPGASDTTAVLLKETIVNL